MKALVAEDDFVSRKILHKLLNAHGECDFVVDGKEAVEAFAKALGSQEPYDLICLDINMPQLSGLEALKQIRQLEESRGIGGLDGVKIVMTTALDDPASVLGAFKAGCEAYVVKPLDLKKLLSTVLELGIQPSSRSSVPDQESKTALGSK
jgi:two-component system chemotaxis response regulator CheY